MGLDHEAVFFGLLTVLGCAKLLLFMKIGDQGRHLEMTDNS
jgi:hypothetical protein